jgi:diguanylate cyclase (GGDEF)-like protein
MLYVAALTLALTAAAGTASMRLLFIDQAARELDDKWLMGRSVLGDLRSELSHHRIAEIDRAAASGAAERVQLEQRAYAAAQAVGELEQDYVELMDQDLPHPQMEELGDRLRTYFAAHDRWQAADRDGAIDAEAQTGGRLEQLFLSAVAASNRLIDANSAAAERHGAHLKRLIHSTFYVVLALSAMVVALTLLILRQVLRNILRPLASITDALGRMAAGERDIEVPGRGRSDEIGRMAEAVDVYRRNAEALEQAHAATRVAQSQAEEMARHDPLTGLPNRRVLVAELEAGLRRTRRENASGAVLLIDLDRFKPVNDLFGHAVGDAVLCEVAQRLEDAAGEGATVARIGGDEFALVTTFTGDAPIERIIEQANEIFLRLREPIAVDDSIAVIDASIGAALFDVSASDPEGLLRAADIAMYRAKRSGPGVLRFFEATMDDELRDRAALEAELREAIAAGSITPYYQPIIDLRDGTIYGFELLARWQHRTRGWVPPERFVALAEQAGMIGELTWSLVARACTDIRQWPAAIRLSVNISPFHLRDPMLAERLLALLVREGVAPGRLDIEITESALVEDLDAAKSTIASLRNLGMCISLDDFGTGYSSLYHLRELSFDKVKIDRSFVQSMHDDNESEKIVDAILGLAANLGLTVVAEGVEDPGLAARLAAKSCQLVQGYYFGKAMPARAALEMLRAPARAISSAA